MGVAVLENCNSHIQMKRTKFRLSNFLMRTILNLPSLTVSSFFLFLCFIHSANLHAQEYNYTEDIQENDTTYNVSTLDEFVVKGEEYSMRDGKITISPSEGIIQSSQFAIDLLSKVGIPGLSYSFLDNSVTVDGTQPVILVNGVISSLQRIRSIKATEVLSIQFSRDVPLVFRKYGNSLIDIRIRAIPSGGSVSLNTMDDVQGTLQDGTLGVTYNRGASQWQLDYSLSHRNNRKVFDSSGALYHAPEMNVELSSELSSPFSYLTNRPSLNYIYNPSSSIILQANLLLSTNSSHRKSDGYSHDSLLGDAVFSAESHDKSINPALNLYLQKSFGEKAMLQAEITGSLSNLNYDLSNDYNYTDTSSVSRYSSATISHRRSLLTNISYSITLPYSTSLEVSYENALAKTSNRYNGDDERKNADEINNYVYAQLTKGIGIFNVGVTTGLRVDYLKEANWKKTFLHNTTLLWMNFNLSRKAMIRLNASYQPQPIALNLIMQQPQQINPYLTVTGNPDLKKPQILGVQGDINLRFGKFGIIPQVGYHRIYNPIALSIAFNETNKGFLRTPVNMRYNDNLTGQLQAYVYQVANMFNFYGTLSMSHYDSKDYSGFSLKKNSISGQVGVDWYYHKWVISFNRSFPGWQLNEYTSIKSTTYSHLMVRWAPSQHWQLAAIWLNMLQPRGWTQDSSITSPYYRHENHRSIRNNANSIMISVSYYCQFGNIFKWKGHDRTLKKSDSQITVTKYE